MNQVFDVDQNKLIEETAGLLKGHDAMQPPAWAPFVKTGAHKQRTPVDEDWWYMRSAAVLRKVKLLGPVGVEKLRTAYGGRKNRGHKPEKFVKGSGSILRKSIQHLEKSGLIRYTEIGVHKGRIITPQGDKLLAQAAKNIQK